MQNSVLFIRRKSAFVLANTLQRDSRVSITSYDQVNLLTFKANINKLLK